MSRLLVSMLLYSAFLEAEILRGTGVRCPSKFGTSLRDAFQTNHNRFNGRYAGGTVLLKQA